MQSLGWVITLISANLMFPLKHAAAGEPVCYSREQIDDCNVVVKSVPCDEQEHQVYKEFTSRENVNLADLMEVKCSLEELPDVLNGKFKTSDCTGRSIGDTCSLTCDDGYYTPLDARQTTCKDKGNNKADWTPNSFSCHEALSCSYLSLPKVTDGFFNISDCSGNNEDDVCNMTCKEHFYPNSPNHTFCENNGNNEGQWSNGDFACYALSCSFLSLPYVTNGIFNISDCSGNNEDDVCSMTCRKHYYPNSPNQTFCGNNGNNEGQWSNGDFSCYALSCSYLSLPNVTNGIFNISDCSGNNEYDVCNMTCREHYYPNSPNQTFCENNGNNEGQWSYGNFSCYDNFITQCPAISPSGDRSSPALLHFTDCYDIFTSGITKDGVYTITPTGWKEYPFDVYCNMSHDGGWTVFQRRVNGSVDFYRDWNEYKEGFGTQSHELWLGNEKLFLLTNQKNYKLRVDYVDGDGFPYYMNYNLFRVANETTGYQLELLGNFTGNSGYDYMTYHRGYPFTTRDRDKDTSSNNCAVRYRGGWWYNTCYSANINGDYSYSDDRGVALLRYDTSTYTYNLRYAQMKIRPVGTGRC